MDRAQRFPAELAAENFCKYHAKQLDIAGFEQSFSKDVQDTTRCHCFKCRQELP